MATKVDDYKPHDHKIIQIELASKDEKTRNRLIGINAALVQAESVLLATGNYGRTVTIEEGLRAIREKRMPLPDRVLFCRGCMQEFAQAARDIADAAEALLQYDKPNDRA